MKYLIDFAVLALLYIFVFFRKWKIKGNDVLLVNTLMYVYISIFRAVFHPDARHNICPAYSEPFLCACESGAFYRCFRRERGLCKAGSPEYHYDHPIWIPVTFNPESDC